MQECLRNFLQLWPAPHALFHGLRSGHANRDGRGPQTEISMFNATIRSQFGDKRCLLFEISFTKTSQDHSPLRIPSFHSTNRFTKLAFDAPAHQRSSFLGGNPLSAPLLPCNALLGIEKGTSMPCHGNLEVAKHLRWQFMKRPMRVDNSHFSHLHVYLSYARCAQVVSFDATPNCPTSYCWN